MSEYKVEIRNNLSEVLTTLNVKIKHFRNFEGRKLSPLGGITVLVDVDTGMMFHSKCRNDELFCRKVGTLNCLQKLLNCKKYKLLSFYNSNIFDVNFGENRMTAWTIKDIPGSYTFTEKFWWVEHKNRIGSKLYSENR